VCSGGVDYVRYPLHSLYATYVCTMYWRNALEECIFGSTCYTCEEKQSMIVHITGVIVLQVEYMYMHICKLAGGGDVSIGFDGTL